MEEKLLELIQKIAEVKGDSNAEVELENKIAFETGKMEGLSLTEKESIVNTIAAKLGGELYTNIFFAFWSYFSACKRARRPPEADSACAAVRPQTPLSKSITF